MTVFQKKGRSMSIYVMSKILDRCVRITEENCRYSDELNIECKLAYVYRVIQILFFHFPREFRSSFELVSVLSSICTQCLEERVSYDLVGMFM